MVDKGISLKTESGSENEQIVQVKIEEIINWCNSQPKIPNISDTFKQLLAMCLPNNLKINFAIDDCFYDLEKTKITLNAYYDLRIKSPEYFSNRNPSMDNLIEASKIAYSILLPGVTDDGYRVITVGYLHTDTTNYVFNDVMKRFMMIIDMWLSKLDICPGYCFLIDCKNSVFTHFTSASFDSLRKFCLYFQEALPVRLQAVIFINISPAVNMLLNVVRPILSRRLVNLIHKYQRGNEEYLQMVPKRMLPKEYGGECKSIEEMQYETQNELHNYAEWFKEQDEIVRTISEGQTVENKSLFGLLF